MKQPISSDATVKPRPLLGDQLPGTRSKACVSPSWVPFTAPLS